MPRKQLLLWLMGSFAVANVLSALATSYGLLMVARFLSGLPHGAYFGVGLARCGVAGPRPIAAPGRSR